MSTLQVGDPTHNALLQIARLLKRANPIPEYIEKIKQIDIPSPRVKLPTTIQTPQIPESNSTLPCINPFHHDDIMYLSYNNIRIDAL